MMILEPLFAYCHGNVSDQAYMSAFLRGELQPFLEKHGVGLILCHLVNKPASNKKERPDWQGGDFAYVGSGSAEIANWCKGVLALRSIGSRDVFELVVGKRHKRAKLTDAEGNVVDRLRLRHATEPGVIFWERAEGDEGLSDEERMKSSALASAFLDTEKSGAACKNEVAKKMGVVGRTVDRMFAGKECVVTPAIGDQPSLTLKRVEGKIVQVEVPVTLATASPTAIAPSTNPTVTRSTSGVTSCPARLVKAKR